MRIIYTWLLLLGGIATGTLNAQELTLLHVKVTGNTQQPVEHASIHLLNSGQFAVADKNGVGTISVRPGKYTLLVSAIGFASATREITAGMQRTDTFAVPLRLSGTQLDAVVVTAEKSEAVLQRIPATVTALSARQVTEYRLLNAKDITAIVPNLYAADPGDDRNVTGIRGIVTTSYNPAVTTYIDGVNQFGLDTYIAPLLDVERIEVLSGPQGTLYGRNAMGGVINIITKQPSNTSSAFAEINMGSYGRQLYKAGFKTALAANRLFFGVAVLADRRNGYYTNQFTNSAFDTREGFTGNYYLKFIASPFWQMTLNVKHNNNINMGAFPLVTGDAFTHPFVLDQNATAKMIDNTADGSLSLNYRGRFFNFSSQTTYQQNLRYYNNPLDGDFSSLDAIAIVNNYGGHWNKIKTWTQEFRFTSAPASNSPLSWTAGAYLFYNNSPVKQGTHFGRDAALVGAPDTNFTAISTSTTKASGLAYYGQAVYAVSKKWNITAGLRYDDEYQKENVLGEVQYDRQPSFVTRPDTSGHTSFHSFSPKLTVSYNASAASIVYLTGSRGFRTGGLTQLSSDPSQPPLYSFRPEYSNNFEAGSKNNFWSNRLQLSLAVFYSIIKNVQLPVLQLPDAVTITKNAGRLNSRGIELKVSATPWKRLEFDYNAGYTHALFGDSKVDQNASVTVAKGAHQVFTPELTSMLAVQYSYPLFNGKALKLVARAEWRYLGNTWFDFANSIKQSSFSLMNVRTGITYKNFDLMFWERNLTNTKYIAYGYDFGAVHLGDPRTLGISLSAHWQ